MIALHNLAPSQARRRVKRVGRGNSSGKGTTAGRGTKGQRARTGGRNKALRRSLKALIERTPKVRGFRSIRLPAASISLDRLSRAFGDGDLITPGILTQQGLIPRRWSAVKVIGTGPLAKKLTVRAHRFSAGAKAALEKSGGRAEIIK